VLVILFRFPIWVPAIVVIGLWIVFQVLSGLATLSAEGGGVAYMAHIGGFAAGVLGGLIVRTLLGETQHARRTPTGGFG
jgi:membrane associated rhomboid family serine protease